MEPLAIAAAVLQARAAAASSSSAAARRQHGRPSSSPRRAPRSRCWDPSPARRWRRFPPMPPDGSVELRRASWTPPNLRRRRARRGCRRRRGRSRTHLRRCARRRRARQRDRQAGASAPSSSAPSSTARRWSSASRRTAPRRCSARPSARASRRCCRRASRAGPPPRKAWRGELGGLSLAAAVRAAVLGGVRRPRAALAGPRPDGKRLPATPARRRGAGTRAAQGAGPRHAGRRRARRSRAADAQGVARAPLGRRDPVRRSGGARGARFRPPRGQAHAGRQDRATAPPASRTRSTR